MLKDYTENLEQYEGRWKKYKVFPHTPAEMKLIPEFEAAANEWRDISERVVDGRKADTRAGRREAIDLTTGFAKSKFEQMRGILDRLTEINLELSGEARRNASMVYRRSLLITAGIAGLGLIIGISLSILLTRGITGPLKTAVSVAGRMSDGELDLEIEEGGGDETGMLLSAMGGMCRNLGGMILEIKSGSETLVGSSSELTGISNQMATNSRNVAGKSSTVSEASEEMSVKMNSVAAAIEQAAANILLVSNATEEMTATINEISQNSEKARTVASDAASFAGSSSAKVNELGKAADEIGQVTAAISDISEQTNLLALNATIEAARAGDAGKGFAVVAGEIKALAAQTADATHEISEKIEGIQASTLQTVEDMSKITGMFSDVNEMVATIATAVEEQAVTTQEISSNVSQASRGISDVSENVTQSSIVAGNVTRDIVDVNSVAGKMKERSSQVSRSAEVLSDLSGTMKQLVDRFRV